MFSYCKRGQAESIDPYRYQTSQLQTVEGFGRGPALCHNMPAAFGQRTRIPRHLVDVEAVMKGQDSRVQVACQNPNEDRLPEFSNWKWLTDTPMARIGQPIPCAPVPVVEVKTYGNNGMNTLCAHAPGVRPCGETCSCSKLCQCKELWKDRNMTRPQTGTLQLVGAAGCRI